MKIKEYEEEIKKELKDLDDRFSHKSYYEEERELI
jgi:hypothetical protein